jgi:predicted phosphodiesterase
MRIALISDIHGNYFALDAALADLQSHAVHQIICLGDTLQGGAQPCAGYLDHPFSKSVQPVEKGVKVQTRR